MKKRIYLFQQKSVFIPYFLLTIIVATKTCSSVLIAIVSGH